MFDHYCLRAGCEKEAMRFIFDGIRIHEDQTPQELNMEDNDVIDVVIQQTGGRGTTQKNPFVVLIKTITQ